MPLLNYAVTSDHSHLLVVGDNNRNVIPNSITLIAGRTGQEYNQRKNRKGGLWEDRYHATAVESGEHLQCVEYIDLTMVLQVCWSSLPNDLFVVTTKPRSDNICIDYERLGKLLGFDSYDRVIPYHQRWIDDYVGN